MSRGGFGGLWDFIGWLFFHEQVTEDEETAERKTKPQEDDLNDHE